jgi:uncharacterized GH25 family protein
VAPGTAAVSGRVLRGAEGEEPVAGAAIEVFAADGGAIPFLEPLAKGESGADGAFRVGGLVGARPYRVRASREGFAPAAAGAAGGGEAVEIRLHASAPVAGTVQDAETKEPLAGALVVAGDAVGARTGPDGAFRVEAAPAGPVQVTATAPGFGTGTAMAGKSARRREGLVLLLGPVSSVAGVVLAPDGAPAAGADVAVEVLAEVPGSGKVPTDTLAGKAGEDGKFRVEAVPVGQALRVSARGEAGFAAPVEAGPLARGKPGEGLVLRLAPGATIVVTVLDEAGKPVEGAAVIAAPEGEEAGAEEADADADAEEAIEPEAMEEPAGPAPAVAVPMAGAGPPAATTDASGVARVRPVPPGRTRVTARKQDLLGAGETVEAAGGAETALTLRLAPGLTLAGKAVDDLGKPVAGASVTVMRFEGEEGVHETRRSGEDGTFRIGGLAGAGFDLAASKEGHVDARLEGVDPAAGPATLTLARAGAVAGVVQDPEGRPVASFRVAVEAARKTPGQGALEMFGFDGEGGTAFEDGEGRFRVGNLSPGTYGVTATAGDFAPGRVADVKVEAAATAEVKVVLAVGHAVQGIVVRKADESPVAGATVSVMRPGPFGEMDIDVDLEGLAGDSEGEDVEAAQAALAAMGGGRRATTGPDGRFVLKGLEAGTVSLRVKAKELAPATQKGVAVPAAGDLRILLSEGAAIEGTIYDAKRAPRKGAMVMLQKFPLSMKMAASDERGRYRISGLPAGNYLFLVMEDPGSAGAGRMSMKSETVTLEEGKTLLKDHRLGEGARLTGRVTRGGKPVGGAMVVLLPGAGRKDAATALVSGSGFAMSTTKEDGTYEIEGLAPGAYTPMVGAGTGGGPAPGGPIEVPPGATEVRRDIALARNAVRGIVVDESGSPVAGARVHAIATGGSVSRAADIGEAAAAVGGEASTGSDGRFALEDMNAGSFTIRVVREGKGAAVLADVVPTEDGTEVRVVLERGVDVTVRVLDAEGKPVPGAGIYLSDARGVDLNAVEMFDAVRTGADGRAVVTVPRGTIHYEAVARGHAPGTAAAPAAEGTEVVIALPRGASLDVLVTDAGGSPCAGAAVRLLDAAGNPYAARLTLEGLTELMGAPATGGDGKYSREDLPAGAYVVRASSGERSADAAVTLVAGERKAVTVRLP